MPVRSSGGGSRAGSSSGYACERMVVRVPPGLIALTRIPSARTSSAAKAVSPSIPNLDTAYGPHSGAGRLPAPEDTLMIEPRRRRRICGRTARMHRNGPRKFTAMVASQSVTLTWSIGARGVRTPALLMRTSTCPNVWSVIARSRSTSRSCETSAFTASASLPSRRTSFATTSTSFGVRLQITTRAPSRANRSVTARPRPRLAPVTMATIPVSLAPFTVRVSYCNGLASALATVKE